MSRVEWWLLCRFVEFFLFVVTKGEHVPRWAR